MPAHQRLESRVVTADDSPDEHVIVYCHHGRRSLDVTNWLRQQGFDKVQSMRGGIDAWSRKFDPKIPTY